MALFHTATVTAILQHDDRHTALFVFGAVILVLTTFLLTAQTLRRVLRSIQSNMAEASAADGQMKDLKISETKKKKDGNPKTAAKKPQQQKKKVRDLAHTSMRLDTWTGH